MKTYLVVTITCPDRPGIVELITDVIGRHSANWEESRMAHLGGEFAGMVMISVPPESSAALVESLRGLATDEMAVTVKITQPPESILPDGSYLCVLRLSGADHEGIVHQVAADLSQQGINVEAMETEVVAAPISGSPLFQMETQLRVPSSITLAQLSSRLQSLAEELAVDIEVSAGTTGAAE